MKYRSLRIIMKQQKLSRPYEYANKPLVVDGLCFSTAYKMSNSQFILGGEYDRFARSLKNILSIYIKSGIDLYVVFNGASKSDMETRKYVHQKIINKTDAIIPGGTYEYCEPIFVKEVYKDVLNELEIKHYTCMYGSKNDLFKLAKMLKCPILTICTEYVLYGVSVIPFRSVEFNEETQSIKCSIYFDAVCKRWCRVSDDLMSVLLTVADEDSNVYNELLNMFSCRPEKYMFSMLNWIRSQSKTGAIKSIKSHLTEENQKVFMDTVAEIEQLFTISPCTPAVDFLIKNRPIADPYLRLENMTDKSFEYNVGVGRIAQPFINLKSLGILSGSWVVYNKDRDDAMLVATDIALYAQSLLTNSQEVTLTFIGRKSNVCDVFLIKKVVNIKKHRKITKGKEHNFSESIDHFQNFVKEHLPGFDLITLENVPEDSWILLISLLYYNIKAKIDITNVVYSIILSYILLGPVSEKVGIIKRSNFLVTHGDTTKESGDVTDTNISRLTHAQCTRSAGAVVHLFYVQEGTLKDNFDRDALHTLSEFQYCLQFMNYLNKLCGEKIKCTAYHKTINCTFIYNIFVALKNESTQEDYIKSLLKCPPVYSYFKNILNTYYKCLSSLNCN